MIGASLEVERSLVRSPLFLDLTALLAAWASAWLDFVSFLVL